LGFKTEGVLREVLLQDGVFADAIIMGMLRSEFLRNRDR
jgi:RimJ/RimL family protein N-acetyltransferase